MSLTDLIADANSALGLAVLLASTISGVIIWFHRRMNSVATDVADNVKLAISAKFEEIDSRVRVLERTVPEQATNIANVERSTMNLGSRIQGIESTLRTLPTKDDLHELSLGMAKVSGDLGKLDERLKPIGSIAERLQEFQLTNGSNK